MHIERLLRLIAGTFILASLALGHWVNAWFYLFTAFVGLNLFQSGLSNWCPMMWFLKLLGVPCAAEAGKAKARMAEAK